MVAFHLTLLLTKPSRDIDIAFLSLCPSIPLLWLVSYQSYAKVRRPISHKPWLN